ncbi:expressed unknown protein [Seminavis robusta]|uniref:Uncharacterized protein n=1 Tax=Seminavis robusta TaxID=568900 RepID=A0A9N8DCZ0_9STRA|nr:expressed unknown protein [Seminavis robusta]|eukprot:Sro33_g021650.1 n/a (199) ;mRNA; r:129684-130280
MAALSHRSSLGSLSSSNTRRSSSGIRIPAWALTRRFQAGSPDSAAKRTVQTLPSVEDDNDSLALPKMEANTNAGNASNSHSNSSNLVTLLQMDVTGFCLEDLHLDLDLQTQRICLAGKGPQMQLFKRAFPIANANSLVLQDTQANIVLGVNQRKFLRLQAPTRTTTTPPNQDYHQTTRKINIPIQDQNRPPTVIQIPN